MGLGKTMSALARMLILASIELYKTVGIHTDLYRTTRGVMSLTRSCYRAVQISRPKVIRRAATVRVLMGTSRPIVVYKDIVKACAETA